MRLPTVDLCLGRNCNSLCGAGCHARYATGVVTELRYAPDDQVAKGAGFIPHRRNGLSRKDGKFSNACILFAGGNCF